MNNYTHALKASVCFRLVSPLLLSTGEEGEFTDSSIDKTPDGKKLHINGYVWNSLLSRAVQRLKGGDSFAKQIGKFVKDNMQVSPLWSESTIVDLPGTDIRPGNRIKRRYGCADDGALYSDEIVPPGIELTLNFSYFDSSETGLNEKQEFFKDALNVIKSGIENIGGGWSYGFGRLDVIDAGFATLDLSNKKGRKKLWGFDDIQRYTFSQPPLEENKIEKKWRRISVTAGILDGQLLAVHSTYPAFDIFYEELPDHFVYRRYRINADKKPVSEVVIPGKTIRQALLSVPIERRLRALGKDICNDPSDKCTCNTCEEYRLNNDKKKIIRSPDCKCKRCDWFGSTDKGGIIAVLDAPVDGAETEILKRVQFCEHSMQNIQLFSGEYLKKGTFNIEIIIDHSRADSDWEGLEKNLEMLLNEMMGNGNAPPGWYRIGATSTCTGQIEVKKHDMNDKRSNL